MIRNEILASLKSTPVEIPDPKKRVRKYKDPTAQFTSRLVASKGEVFRVENLSMGFETLGELFKQIGIHTVVAHRESPLDDPGLASVFPEQTWYFAGDEDDYRGVCASADAGLTSAAYALAETGSLVIVPGTNHSRLTSLLPPVHIVMLPESKIISSIYDWVALRPERLPSNLVLISGPSKTADIEQTLVVGVHGPKRLIVIVHPE